MAKDIKEGENESVVRDGLHKSSGSAVPSAESYSTEIDPDDDKVWLVAVLSHQKYTESCCKYVKACFDGVSCYVPAKKELKVYPNRTRRTITKFVIPRFVFVSGIKEDDAYEFVKTWPNADYFMPDRAKAHTGHVHLAEISHKELVKFHRVIQGVESVEDIEFTTKDLKFDDTISVVDGELAGLEGGYLNDEGKDFLVMMLGKLGNIKVRVSIKNCVLKQRSM